MLKDFKTEIKLFVLVALIAAVVSVAGILLLRGMMPAPQPSPSPQAPDTFDGSTSLTAGWQTYRNDELGFEVKYPPKTTVYEEGQKHFILELAGPTQIDNTELFDGLLFTISKDSYGSIQTMKDYAEGKMNEEKNNPDIETTVREPLREITINGINGYTFVSAGYYYDVGTRFVYLSLDDQSFISISYVAPDPTKQGFQRIGDQILATFRFVE